MPSGTPLALPSARPTLATGSPTGRPSAAPSGVRVYTGRLTLSVYPFEPFLKWSTDPVSGVRYATLDRAAYEASNPAPQPRPYDVVYLENEYLRLAFLPRWGGRLYQATYLPTGQTLFYNNKVVKPSRWGPFDADRNWWLALGGMEWAAPVQEHGYEWGVPWTYRTQSDGSSASIVLQDSAEAGRVQVQVTVTLARGQPGWGIAAQVVNATPRAVPVQFWLNAALTLGGRTIAPETEFDLPGASARVHSTGDSRLPGEKQSIAWPVYNGVDYSRYRNWQNWAGLFAVNSGAGRAGAYNPAARLAVTRTYPPATAPGVKLFAFGPQFPDRSYTDDGSQYFELWGGPNRTFWPDDDVTLAPGQMLGWSEQWRVEAR